MSQDEKIFKHESYGMIAVSRTHGRDTVPMFGSSLESNPTRMSIRISRGTRRHSLGRDWYMPHEELIEVYLTPAQYAEMLSNPNSGTGVPCTISHINRVQVDDPPRTANEAGEVRSTFEKETAGLREKAKKGRKLIADVLEGTKLPQKHKDTILHTYEQAVRFLGDSAPFLVESFQEAVQNTVIEAKLEIDAFMTHAIHNAGVARKQLQKTPVTLTLEAGRTDELGDPR